MSSHHLLPQQRNAFVEHLLQHLEAGRIHNQDAELQVRDPEALLSLPEFIRESLPQSEMRKDGETLLSLPEFVREPLPSRISSKMSKKAEEFANPKQRKRSRSSSAPPLAWLRSSSSKTTNVPSSLVKIDSQGHLSLKASSNFANSSHRFRCCLCCRESRESTTHSRIL